VHEVSPVLERDVHDEEEEREERTPIPMLAATT